MKASPITFRELKFLKVQVETNPRAKKRPDEFDFDGSSVGWLHEHGRPKSGGSWWILMGFLTGQDDQEDPEITCPYVVDVQAVGLFDIDERVPEEDRERIVYENGAALVYGALREMVSTITARSMYGLLMLPTPRFLGSYQEMMTKGAVETANAPAPDEPTK